MGDCNLSYMLCCIFNYPPLYRASIYKQIDALYDSQFYFGNEVIEGKHSGIKKIDFSIFKRKPIEIKNIAIGSYIWRTGISLLPVKKKYSVFLITGDIVLSYIPFLILCRIFNKRVYAWGHGFKHAEGKTRWLIKFFFSHLSGYFTYGEKGKQRLIELGIPSDKLTVIYNSLTDKIFPEHQKELRSDLYLKHFGNRYKTLIFIGRLTSEKKLDWIIKAMIDHKTGGFLYNLILIGTGPTEKKLFEMVDKSDIKENVWFYGESYNEVELSSLIYNADLCVSPGNIGLTAMHVMEYGVPALTHDNFEKQGPEYEAIIPGKTGVLYKYDDFNDYKDQLRKWLSSDINRDEVRQNCYDMIKTRYNSNNQMKIISKTIGIV